MYWNESELNKQIGQNHSDELFLLNCYFNTVKLNMFNLNLDIKIKMLSLDFEAYIKECLKIYSCKI